MRRVCGISIIAGLLMAAPAQAVRLVNSRGQPVGGKWQSWADQAKVPTVRGTLTFWANASVCNGAAACSWGPPWFGPNRGTAVSDGVLARDDLYFELGHQFDWQVLTWADRRYLERHWRILDPDEPYPFATLRWWHWPDSARSVKALGEDGMEAVFAGIYEDCALGENDRGAGISQFEPAGVVIPVVIPKIDTCAYVGRIARRS